MGTTLLLLSAVLLAASGIALAWWLSWSDGSRARWERSLVHRALAMQCYSDELYLGLFVEPLRHLSRGLSAWDVRGIDRVLAGAARLANRAGDLLRQLQTGRVGDYLLGFVGGVIALKGYLLLWLISQGMKSQGSSSAVMLIVASGFLALAGIGWAWRWYGKRSLEKEAEGGPSPLQDLLVHGYFVDQFYAQLVVRPASALARWLGRFDAGVIDGAVNGSAAVARRLSRLTRRSDDTVVDGAVRGFARLIGVSSAVLRRLQTGRAQHYLLAMVAGLVGLLGLALFLF